MQSYKRIKKCSESYSKTLRFFLHLLTKMYHEQESPGSGCYCMLYWYPCTVDIIYKQDKADGESCI